MLRWILVHKMSPAHGYLHITSGYPSLAYDLMEPYRYIVEEAVEESYKAQAKDLTAASLEAIKTSLESEVFVPSHRTMVRRKNLLHGAVLSLRAWLLGEVSRLVFPTEGERIGGRKPKVGYLLPGSQRVH
jgi:CRISPR/Cas system-associated endonuclease Cas1